MTVHYDTIKPANILPGDVIELTFNYSKAAKKYTVTGPVWIMRGRWYVGEQPVDTAEEVRLVDRPVPPEPPLRVGDWVRDNILHREGQITETLSNGHYEVRVDRLRVFDAASLTRIEPPVGWPVGVPPIDAPTVWYFKSTSSGKYVWCGDVEIDFSWSDLLAAGGTPAVRP
jgi:hypothetical protein